jgi:hypothetical protein
MPDETTGLDLLPSLPYSMSRLSVPSWAEAHSNSLTCSFSARHYAFTEHVSSGNSSKKKRISKMDGV